MFVTCFLWKKNNKKPRITNCIRTLSFATREEKCKSWESWITDRRYPSISSGITCIRFQSRKNWRTEKLPSGNDFAKHQIITSCLSKELTYLRFSYCILRDIAVIQSQHHQLEWKRIIISPSFYYRTDYTFVWRFFCIFFLHKNGVSQFQTGVILVFLPIGGSNILITTVRLYRKVFPFIKQCTEGYQYTT